MATFICLAYAVGRVNVRHAISESPAEGVASSAATREHLDSGCDRWLVFTDEKALVTVHNGGTETYYLASPAYTLAIKAQVGDSLSHVPPVTNLLADNTAFDTWTAIGCTVTPDVEGTADRMTEAAGLTQHNLTPVSTNFTLGETYTASLNVKYENAQFVQLLLGGAAFGANAWCNFDIMNGTVETGGAAATGAVRDLGDGWFRISVTAIATATAAAPFVVFGADTAAMSRALSYTGDTGKTRLLDRAQIEVGAVGSMWVP